MRTITGSLSMWRGLIPVPQVQNMPLRGPEAGFPIEEVRYGNDGYVIIVVRGPSCDEAPACLQPSAPRAGRERRPMATHRLKTWPEFFHQVVTGAKTFEIRREDRPPGFQAGDVLRLQEWSAEGGYTGREVTRSVTYVLRGMGVADGYVCMALAADAAPRPARGAGMLSHEGATVYLPALRPWEDTTPARCRVLGPQGTMDWLYVYVEEAGYAVIVRQPVFSTRARAVRYAELHAAIHALRQEDEARA